tara:strand:- start:2657 stop:2977 length:321 start_codon:yes stop_codon:yes gene_type:complete
MLEILLIIGVIIIFILAFVYREKKEMSTAEENRTEKRKTKEKWSKETHLTYGEVQSEREKLISIIENELPENLSDQKQRLISIINDWADLKIKSFEERRSWVRKPK